MDALKIYKSEQHSEWYIQYIPCVKKDTHICICVYIHIYVYMYIYMPIFLKNTQEHAL